MLSKTGILFTIAVFYAALSIFLSFDLTGFTTPDIYTYSYYEDRNVTTTQFIAGEQTLTCAEAKNKGWLWQIFHADISEECHYNTNAAFSMLNIVDNLEALGWLNIALFAPLIFILGWIGVSTFFPTASGGS